MSEQRENRYVTAAKIAYHLTKQALPKYSQPKAHITLDYHNWLPGDQPHRMEKLTLSGRVIFSTVMPSVFIMTMSDSVVVVFTFMASLVLSGDQNKRLTQAPAEPILKSVKLFELTMKTFKIKKTTAPFSQHLGCECSAK